MKRTIPYVVSCLSLYVLGCILLPLELRSMAEVVSPTYNTPGDTLTFSVNECDETVSICLDSLPLATATNLAVTVNGSPYQGTLAGCNFDTISAYTYTTLFGQGDSGPYVLTNWTVGEEVFTGHFENIPDLVDSMNLWDAGGNWQLDEEFKLISGGKGNTDYSDMIVEVVGLSSPSFIGYNFGIEARGIQLNFGTGVHRVSILDSLNNTFRSAVVIVSCSNKRIVEDRVLPGEIKNYCLDQSRLMTAPVLVGFCGLLSQENVDFEILNESYCTNFTGVSVGLDSACIVLCDSFSFCDTTILVIETYDQLRYRETVLNIKEGTNQVYCIDTTSLFGKITSLSDNCSSKNGTASKVNLDNTTYCATIYGEVPGQDTTCLILCNQVGRCDTTILYINVHPAPTTERITLSITEGDSTKIYPSSEELAGVVTGIANFCENNSTETIISNINNVDLYFNISAQKLGIDSICAVICDNFLICDTTYYIISVVSRSPSLTATPDLDSTSINSPISINILGNDSIPDGIITEMELITLSTEPTSSTITFNPDGTLNYVPTPDFCGDTDQFQYRICNNAGCDTTTVMVFVECPPPSGMKFYNGFSPNGDGANDFFKIEGIAQYPNNELVIYNRWGTKVFRQKGYKNAWDGTWNNTILPNGTYFYVLKDGVGKRYSGYVEISR